MEFGLPKIAIVTPLKNEIENIDRLVEAINAQTLPINTWLILENDSSDGSKQKLQNIGQLENVSNFQVINIEMTDKAYRLGSKYSWIVQQGFEMIKSQNSYDKIDFIGILDADCFPEVDYYQELTHFMYKNTQLGISSGITVDESGNLDLRNKNWVRGSCRLWKKACFEEAGYLVGPSADTLSATKAQLKGWKVYSNPNLKVVSREIGHRVNFNYYGYSVYYRGHTFLYALLHGGKLFLRGYFKKTLQFLNGYIAGYIKGQSRIDDPEIFNFHKNYLTGKRWFSL